MENDTPIYVNNTQIENCESYVYLGQRYSIIDTCQEREIQKRITAGGTAFAKHRDVFKGNIGIYLKRKVYNTSVLAYPAETWALTSRANNMLAAAQTKMERSMLNITYRDRKTNIWVREKTNVTDVIEQFKDGSRPGQGRSAGYDITDGHCVSPHGNPMKEKSKRKNGETLERRTTRLLEGYHLAEDRARCGSSTGHYGCTMTYIDMLSLLPSIRPIYPSLYLPLCRLPCTSAF